MPRSTYYQCPANPIQLERLPSQPLSLEFAAPCGSRRKSARQMREMMAHVFCITVLASFAYLLPHIVPHTFCWIVTILGLLLYGIVQCASTKNPAIAAVGFASALCGVLASISIPFAVTIIAAFLANILLSREVVRHFTFVKTTAPMSQRRAWKVRDSMCWQTLICSVSMLPLLVVFILPRTFPFAAALTIVLLGVLAACFVQHPEKYLSRLKQSFVSWCTYEPTKTGVPGILRSPAGSRSTRIAMLGTTVALNSFAIISVLVRVVSSIDHERVRSEIEQGHALPVFLAVCSGILIAVVFPSLIQLCSLAAIGIPAFGSFWARERSASEDSTWTQTVGQIRRSPNSIERDSLFMGKVASDQSPVLVPTKVFNEHAHFLGDSGSGKTARGLAPVIEQVFGRGDASVMLLDLKADSQELLQTLFESAKQAESKPEVRYFSPRDDQATFGFNPFQLECWSCLNDLQKTDVLCGALGLSYGTDYGEGYFSSANASVLYATVSAFPNVQTFAELRQRLDFVISQPASHGLDTKSRDAGNHVRMLVTRLATIKALNVTSEKKSLKDVADAMIDPSRLFTRPEAHFFSLSSSLGPSSSPEIARFATFMLLTAATLAKRTVPVYLVIDEFQRMASRNLDYLLQLARSMGVSVILANQSMQDLKRYDLTATLETNCRYRQWFAISGWEDQERLSKSSGETVDTLDSLSVTHSINANGASDSTNFSTRQFVGPRLTNNDIKLISDDDRKSVMLINRGADYAQYGGMPVVIESPFHISMSEYERRRDEPWPSGDIGTFLPCETELELPLLPRRGKPGDIIPPIATEVAGSESKAANATKRRTKRKSKRNTAKVTATEATSTQPTGSELFDQYIADHPMDEVENSCKEEVQ